MPTYECSLNAVGSNEVLNWNKIIDNGAFNLSLEKYNLEIDRTRGRQVVFKVRLSDICHDLNV